VANPVAPQNPPVALVVLPVDRADNVDHADPVVHVDRVSRVDHADPLCVFAVSYIK